MARSVSHTFPHRQKRFYVLRQLIQRIEHSEIATALVAGVGLWLLIMLVLTLAILALG